MELLTWTRWKISHISLCRHLWMARPVCGLSRPLCACTPSRFQAPWTSATFSVDAPIFYRKHMKRLEFTSCIWSLRTIWTRRAKSYKLHLAITVSRTKKMVESDSPYLFATTTVLWLRMSMLRLQVTKKRHFIHLLPPRQSRKSSILRLSTD